mgnify:CR=1 FL=1
MSEVAERRSKTLSPVERKILSDLLLNGDNVAGNIARNRDAHAGSVSRSMKNLRDEGLVSDKGNYVWTLTRAGVVEAQSLVGDRVDPTTEECPLCGDEVEAHRIEEHHVSYEEDVTVTVCRTCHTKIHNTDGFATDLEPDMSLEEAQERGFADGGDSDA